MRGFGSIVGVSLHTMSHVAEDGSHGCGVASQFVGNDPQWFGTLGRATVFERIVLRRADHDAAGLGCRSRRPPDPRHATDTAVGR
jgi:hypothetical protein